MSRYVSIWFPYLLTDFTARKRPELRHQTFALALRRNGRMVVEAANAHAVKNGIRAGMVLADCKAIFPQLEVLEAKPGQAEKCLTAWAEWSIRYSPIVAIDPPDGLVLDATGCAHLFGGEAKYLGHIEAKFSRCGFTIRAAMADTVGMAWAMARFGSAPFLVAPGRNREAIQLFPPAALRLEYTILARLKKLGLVRVEHFIDMPPSALRRRFGPELPQRIAQVLGREPEIISPVKWVEPYQERLCSMEPIASATGIGIALQQLIDALCLRFEAEGMGLRQAVFRVYRVDGDVQQIEIGTGHSSRNTAHLFQLFSPKIASLQPDLGFEVFVLEAPKTETVTHEQAAIWHAGSQKDKKVAELLDRVEAKVGAGTVKRYVPAEHYWPERSVKPALPLWEEPHAQWRTDWPRPVHLLPKPEAIEVTAVLPDYPPMLFRHKGKLFQVVRSDGPERIEQEWWLQNGLFRDYYLVEDQYGARFWLFRSGPYEEEKQPEWFLHGFFA